MATQRNERQPDMTLIPVTERLYLAWDDFNWIVLRKRAKRDASL